MDRIDITSFDSVGPEYLEVERPVTEIVVVLANDGETANPLMWRYSADTLVYYVLQLFSSPVSGLLVVASKWRAGLRIGDRARLVFKDGSSIDGSVEGIRRADTGVIVGTIGGARIPAYVAHGINWIHRI